MGHMPSCVMDTQEDPAMEDEDFGFTKRDDKILQKILTGPISKNAQSSSSLDTSERNSLEEEAEKVPRLVSNFINANDRFALTPAEGVAKGPKSPSLPETGSDRAGTRPRSKASVARETPNIPNVVEYHLKVKPGTERKDSVICSDSIESSRNMKKDSASLSSNEEKKKKPKSLSSSLSKMTIDSVLDGQNELPQTFQVKYLGSHRARGLWGIHHTRKPVDNMVAAARSLPTGTILPFMKLIVSEDGVALLPLGKMNLDAGFSRMYPIKRISYGVQDLVYTRVFCMIVVKETTDVKFECHGFVCESKQHARQLTCALACAFQIYSQNVKAQGRSEETAGNFRKRFAIDLRSPDDFEADLIDSEA